MEDEKLVSEKLSFKWGRRGKWEWKSLKLIYVVRKVGKMSKCRMCVVCKIGGERLNAKKWHKTVKFVEY